MTNSLIPLITIDGPSGSGKGTVASLLAQKLGYHLLDSGAIYRVLAVASENNKLNLDDETALVKQALTLPVEFIIDTEHNQQSILLEGVDITKTIRTETVGKLASQIAIIATVREALLQRQRAFLQPPGLIADGRDMGTVVFPSAPLKIFLTASAEERARRRYNQLKTLGEDVKMGSLIKEIKDRDERDTTRSIAPLKPAHDAVIIDSTALTLNQVMDKVLEELSQCSVFN